jgi:ABC transport system ATP-binding/permease protein
VTARRKRNQGRLAKLHEMRATRAAMLAPAGTAKLGLVKDDSKTKSVITAEHVTKRFGTRIIIKDFSFRVQRGDRIGLVGANGAGKTTLLKLLTGEIAPDEGKVIRAKTLDGIVIDQQRALLHPDKRVRDVLADGGDWITVRGEKKHIRGYLKDFLFDPAMVEARIGTLSGGEQSRLLLAREFARESNLLVLDEPTNDLDLETLDLLQEVIADYEGTVLLVSHDRDFLDRTVTVTLGLDGTGHVDVVAGGYADWVAQRKSAAKRHTAPLKATKETQSAPDNVSLVALAGSAGAPVRKKLSYKDQRDYELLPQRIDAIDAAMAKAEAALADPDLYVGNFARFEALTAELDTLRAEKETAEERWLTLAEEVETLG